MTTYFDSTHARLREQEERWKRLLAYDEGLGESSALDPSAQRFARPEGPCPMQEAEKIEEKLLFDVQLCASLPGFPEDLKDQILLHIARLASDPLGNGRGAADDVDEAAMFRRLHDLCYGLHTLFHYLGQRELPKFSDKPDSILRCHADLGDRMLELMRQTPDLVEKAKAYDDYMAKIREELEKP